MALVTGAGRGIGAAIARRLSVEGATVAVNDMDPAAASAVTDELLREGRAAIAVAADVSVASQVEAMTAKVAQTFGGIDILVNNAGIERDALVHKMTEEDWDAVIATNLKSCFLCSRAVVPAMLRKGFGRIISISSRACLGGYGQASYSASKGGIVSLTRTLALELASKGITVNCVAPGLIDTPLFRSFRPDVQERLLKLQPSRRVGRPEDVAYAVACFVSDEASYITGQTLYACGGKSVGQA